MHFNVVTLTQSLLSMAYLMITKKRTELRAVVLLCSLWDLVYGYSLQCNTIGLKGDKYQKFHRVAQFLHSSLQQSIHPLVKKRPPPPMKTQTASRKIMAVPVLCICCGGSSFEDKEYFMIFCIWVLKATVSQNKQAPKHVHLRIDKIRKALHQINTSKNKLLAIDPAKV